MHIGLDAHIRNELVRLKGGSSHHVDAGSDDISQVVDLGIALVSVRKVDTDYYVGSAFLCKVGRVVVPHASVNQHHSIHLDRCKQRRDGHG